MRRIRIPKVQTPPLRYEVWWVDANYDNEYDGPVKDFKSELLLLPHVGYHTKTTKTTVDIASEATVHEGEVSVRDIMTIPRVHIVEMRPLYTLEEARAVLQKEVLPDAKPQGRDD